jgi:hypothetical protein
MKVLLVEPNYKTRFAPFGLMKISAMHKEQGDTVKLVKGRKKVYTNDGSKAEFDVIYITSMFTFFYKEVIEAILYYQKHYHKAEIKVGGIFASIMPEYIKRHTGISPHIGVLPEAEGCIPDYDIIQSTHPKIFGYNDRDTSLAFTSRGCIRKCQFCVVPKIEGKVYNIPNWETHINIDKPAISFMDNNWFAKDEKSLDEDIEKINDLLKRGIKYIDFNQALDARLFTEKIAKKMTGIPLEPVRFAFDNKSEDGPVQKAIAIAREYGFMHSVKNNRDWNAKQSNSSIYVLYNFKDDPAFFYYRIREICKAGAAPTPLRFCPIDSIRKTYLGPKWKKEYITAINYTSSKLFSKIGTITSYTKEDFEMAWGRNVEEFMGIISSPNAKKIADTKFRKRQLNSIREAS